MTVAKQWVKSSLIDACDVQMSRQSKHAGEGIKQQ